jgi:hypothetical protein
MRAAPACYSIVLYMKPTPVRGISMKNKELVKSIFETSRIQYNDYGFYVGTTTRTHQGQLQYLTVSIDSAKFTIQ